MKDKTLPFLKAARAAFVVLLLAMAGLSQVKAQTVTVDRFNYTINEDGASVTVVGFADGVDDTGELVIPDAITLWGNTYPVTAIGGNAFYERGGITSVFTGNSVTYIGGYAFAGCTRLSAVLFEGNAPVASASVFGGEPEAGAVAEGFTPSYVNDFSVAEDCCAYVLKISTGWGVDIPGSWNGIRIAYLQLITPAVLYDLDVSAVQTVAKSFSDRVSKANGDVAYCAQRAYAYEPCLFFLTEYCGAGHSLRCQRKSDAGVFACDFQRQFFSAGS